MAEEGTLLTAPAGAVTPAGVSPAATATPPPEGGVTPPTDGSQPASPTAPAFSLYGADGRVSDALVSQIPEKYKSARSMFSKYASAEELAKGIENMQYLAAQKGFDRPADDAPQSVRDAFNARLRQLSGVPEKADDYKITKPADLPDGIMWDDASVKEFAKLAHEKGMTPAQVESAVKFQTGMVQRQLEQYAAQQAKAREEATAALDKAFGPDKSVALARVKNYAISLGLDPDKNQAFNDPAIIVALHKAAEMVGESKFTNGGGIDNSASIEQQMKDLAAKSMEAMKKGDYALANKYSRDQSQLAMSMTRRK